MVDGTIISQGGAINRGVLTQAIIEASSRQNAPQGNIIFGKQGCPHCRRARNYLKEAGIPCRYRDVIREPAALYEMLVRVKAIAGPHRPITVPQIWLDGTYVGGADALSTILHRHIDPNPERGQCSLSAAEH